MSAALKEEIPHSPLTAESTLVKTVIKEIPEVSSTEREFKSPNSTQSAMTNNTLQDWTLNKNSSLLFRNNYSNSSQSKLIESDRKEINNTKILSTAVVTSVSVKDSAEDAKEALEVVPTEEITTSSTASPVSSSTVSILPPFDIVSNTNIPSDDSPPRSLIYNKSLTSSTPKTFSDDVNASTGYVRTTTVRNNTPLRSRDIYNKPRTIPAGISLPHLPRQIPFLLNKNMSLRTSSPVETTSLVNNLEKSSRTDSPLIHSTPSTPSTLPEEQTPGIVTTFTPSTTIQTTVTITPPESISRHSSAPTVIPQSQQNSVANTTAYVPLEYLANNSSTNPTSVKTLASSIDKTILSTTTSSTTDVLEQSTKGSLQDSIRGNEHNTSLSAPSADEEEAPQHVEGQSVPPPKYEEPAETTTSTSAYSPEDDADQFPIYFTTLPTATVPVVDTRPETEEAVVEEQRNTTSPRPGADWVKVGAVDKEVEVVYPEPLGLGAYLLAALGVVPVVLGALIGARFILAHNKKKVLDESEYSSEYNRSPLGISTSSPLPTKLPRIPTHVSWGETEKSAPTITPVTSAAARWEFPRDKLRLQTLLGQGNFGQVWKAEADDISGHEGLTRLVAVKTVKESATSREREDLLRELGIMQELGSHPNVVTLLGCCTEKEPIYLLMEYVMYGKLLSFLRDHRTRAHYYNFSDAGDALTSRDLTVFGYCVARGMDYLTNKSIIHRDMAARNVLVDHNKLCKIADFGMSRNVRDTGQIYEQRQSKGALPIRWMAPESLHFSLFTHKTDVWSFGILMWEIVTLGSTPYATMGAREVMRRVGDGYRLERPSHCRSELFRVIAKCWHSEPSKRPTFAELKVELGQLLSDSELNGSYVDLDSFADEMRRDTLHRHH